MEVYSIQKFVVTNIAIVYSKLFGDSSIHNDFLSPERTGDCKLMDLQLVVSR